MASTDTTGSTSILNDLGNVLVGGVKTGIDAYFRPTDPAQQVTQTPDGLQKQGTQLPVTASMPTWVWIAGGGALLLVVLLVARR